MKAFILTILFTTSALASNWVPVSVISANGNSAYTLKSECEKVGPCVDVGSEPEAVSLGFVSTSFDWEAASDVESCSGQEDCELKLADKMCPESRQKFINEGYTEVYCTKQIYSAVLDSTSFNAYKATKAAQSALEAALAQAEKAMECGKSAQALLLVRNAQKGLTTAQVKSIVATYAPIKQLLDTGSLVTAIEEIQAVTADGTLVTEADKTALVDHINDCKP